jgi:hypothetical protein
MPRSDSEATRVLNFNRFPEFVLPNKIPDLVSQAVSTGKSEVVVTYPDLPPMHHRASLGPFPEADLVSLSANSDIVLEGLPESRKSGPCAADTFVCSDYTVSVTRVWKNRGAEVLAGQSIIVARGGGQFTENGLSIRGIVGNFQLFKLGETYIFFLSLLPESGAFKVGPGRAFLEQGDQIVDGRTYRGIPATDRSVFLEELQRAVSVPHREAQR